MECPADLWLARCREVGFRIIAAARLGLLTISCQVCQDDPIAKDVWGCERPTQAAVWTNDGEEFYNCPIRFVPDNVWAWFSELTFAEQFHQIKPYSEMPARWIEALHYLKNMMDRYTEQIQETKSRRKDRTGDGLARLAAEKNQRGRTDN